MVIKAPSTRKKTGVRDRGAAENSSTPTPTRITAAT